MILKNLEISDYRSCMKTKLSPNPDLTALIGVNGAGKSNLLNAILLLKRFTGKRFRASKLEGPYTNSSKIRIDLDVDGQPVAIRGTVFYETNERNIDEVVGTRLKWNLKGTKGRGAWIDLPIEMLIFGDPMRFVLSKGRKLSYRDMERGGWYSVQEMKTLLPEDVFPIVMQIVEYFNDFNYYSASQFSDPTRCPVSIELEDDRLLGYGRREHIDHQRFILDLYQAFKENGAVYKRFRNVVNEEGIGLISDIEFKEIEIPSNVFEVKAGGRTVERKRVRTLVVPVFLIDGNRLSPNQLSEGTFKTLALLFYVITDKSRLLLIEEPEVCIHHGLLNSIMTLIKEESKQKQIIISTHSDYVLDQLEPENVVIVTRTADKGTSAKPITKSLSKSDFRALKSYLEDAGNLGEYWREGGMSSD